jgi:hypothetical protein
MSLFAQTIRSRNALLLGAVLVGVLGYVYYCLFVDYSMGGNSWKQGDWLINELAGPIRRGLFGSALLHVSDALGANPLVLLIVLQASIVTLIFAVLGIAAFDLKVPDKLLLILLSPGFVIFFWFNDPLGSMRKELLTYLAFVPLVVAALRGRGGYAAYAFSTVAYGVAMSAHEGNVFFLPFLCTAMWLILPPEASIRLRLALLAVPCLLAFGGGLYASLYTHVSDYSVLCAPLLERGLDASICDGAIAYVETLPDDSRMDWTGLFSTHFRNFLLIYAACLISFRVLVQGSPRVALWSFAVIASGLVVAPLFVLAGDYGRWLSFHVSSLVFIALICLLKWRPSWLYEPPMRLDFAAVLAMSLLIGIKHVPGEMTDGALVKTALAIHHALE